jgi:hypothetical protein
VDVSVSDVPARGIWCLSAHHRFATSRKINAADDIDLPMAGAKAAKEGSTERGKIVGQNVVPLVRASANHLEDQALSA